MKDSQGRSFEATGRLITALNAFEGQNSRVRRIPVMPGIKGTQYIIGETTIVLTYQPTAKSENQVLHEWYSLDSLAMKEAKALVKDAYDFSNIPWTEELNYD
jgi:hypothetical protein